MSESKKKVLHLVLSIVIAVLTCVVGILIITSCIEIYKSGYRLFSPETIGQQFKEIAPWIFIFIALVVVGFAINIFMPREQKRLKGETSDRVSLARLKNMIDYEKCPEDIARQIQGQINLRLGMIISSFILVLLGVIFSAVYALNLNNYPYADANAEVMTVFLVTVRYLIIPFAYTVATSYVVKHSYKRELALAKEAIKVAKTSNPVVKKPLASKKFPLSLIVTCTIIFVGVLFVILGILNGGNEDVIAKAVKICTECIGLG